MATPSFSLSTLHSIPKQELYSDSTTPMQSQSLPALPQDSEAISPVKVEPLELSDVSQQQGVTQEPSETQISQSIDQLTNLSSAINEFYRRFDHLKKHLDFIRTSIDARSNGRQHIQSVSAIAPPPMSNSTAQQGSAVAPVAEVDTGTRMPESSSAPRKSELITLCEMMCGRGLRKYLTSRLSKIRELRLEVPLALQCAPQPAKLVLECFGRFYLQGIRAYNKNSPMVTGRKASVLILEFFMLMINKDIQFDSEVKQEAEQAAIAWRQRLIAEGGINKACQADARGLLLFVGCYGIPKVFSNEDIWDLVKLSNSKLIADALRRSHILVNRVSDILERMMNNAVKIDAIDVASTFGLEDRFPPQRIVTSYLKDSKEAMKRRTREANNSPVLLKEASERQLASLKSVVKFLEDRNLDPVKLSSGWQIREKIDLLEKDIAVLKKKIDETAAAKRKADEHEYLNNLKNQEAKRHRYTGSPIASSPNLGLHEPRASLYNGSMQLNLSDNGGLSGHINNPGVGSIMHGSSSFSASAYGVPSASSYARSRAELLVNRYGRHGAGEAPVIDGLRQSYAYQPASGLFPPSASLKGFAGLPNSSPTPANRTSATDLYRFADTVN